MALSVELPDVHKTDSYFMVIQMNHDTGSLLSQSNQAYHFSKRQRNMNSSMSTARSSSPSSDGTTSNSCRGPLQSPSVEHLLVPESAQESHLKKANASHGPTGWSTSCSSVHLGTLNPLIQKLDDQPDYPYPEPSLSLKVDSPALAPSVTNSKPLQSSPLDFAHPAGLDHGEKLEIPELEVPYSEVSADASVPLSLALRQLELWDEVPSDFPQQVALFLAQDAGQEAQVKPDPRVSLNEEETFTELKRAGYEEEQEEEEEEVITIQLDLNAEVAASIQTSISQHSTEEKLIAYIEAPRLLAEELQRLTVKSSIIDGLPSIDSVLQSTPTRKLVLRVQLFREVI